MFGRFLGIKKIGGNALKWQVAAAIVVGIWIYNAAFNIPMFLWSDVFEGWGAVLSCYARSDPAYVLAARIINFYVPLVITWTSNIGIIYKLRRSMNKASPTGAVLAQKFSGALPPSLPLPPLAHSSPSPFSPFSETEKIRTSYRPTFEIYH